MDGLTKAADAILRKWKAAYDDLLMPAFDAHHVFGEAITPDDIRALDEALATELQRDPMWNWESRA
jgi:hypothetical protein